MNDIIVIFAFLRYCLGCKVDMGRVVACLYELAAIVFFCFQASFAWTLFRWY